MTENQQLAAFIVVWLISAISYFMGMWTRGNDGDWNPIQGLFALFVIGFGGIASLIMAGNLIYRACQL